MEVIKGSDLKLLLKKKGITSNFISDKLLVHKTTVSGYFTDRIAMPATFILKVASLAGLEMSDLIKVDHHDATPVAMEPPAAYERKQKYNKVEIRIDGLSLLEYVEMIERRLSDMERKIKALQNKNELETV